MAALAKRRFALVAPASGTNNTGTFSFSGEAVGPINSSIGIFNHFTLTSGDLASATSVFKVVSTVAPEPASITLSLLGLVGAPLALRLRRR